jgi:hypothetical protein
MRLMVRDETGQSSPSHGRRSALSWRAANAHARRLSVGVTAAAPPERGGANVHRVRSGGCWTTLNLRGPTAGATEAESRTQQGESRSFLLERHATPADGGPMSCDPQTIACQTAVRCQTKGPTCAARQVGRMHRSRVRRWFALLRVTSCPGPCTDDRAEWHSTVGILRPFPVGITDERDAARVRPRNARLSQTVESERVGKCCHERRGQSFRKRKSRHR